MGWKKGYKVVLKQEDRFCSCVEDDERSIVFYTPNVRTYPRKGCGPLCCFSDRKSAEKFISSERKKGGFECAILCIFKCKYIESKSKKDRIWARFPYWDGKRLSWPKEKFPKGTVFASSVILNEKPIMSI